MFLIVIVIVVVLGDVIDVGVDNVVVVSGVDVVVGGDVCVRVCVCVCVCDWKQGDVVVTVVVVGVFIL